MICVENEQQTSFDLECSIFDSSFSTTNQSEADIMPKNECVDCGNFLKDSRSVRCKSCFMKGELNHRYGTKVSEITRKRMIHSAQSGEKNHFWKGGRFLNKVGYVLIHQPNHPNPTDGNHVFEHRLVMEKHLGRYLTKEEHIHHINFDKEDNQIENLHLFANNSEHNKYHAYLKRLVCQMVGLNPLDVYFPTHKNYELRRRRDSKGRYYYSKESETKNE